MLQGLGAVLVTLMVLATAVVGAVCWGVAKRWPVVAGPSFVLTFVLTFVAVSLGARGMSEMHSHGMLVGASPVITIGIPAACGFLGYATYRISKLITAEPATGDE